MRVKIPRSAPSRGERGFCTLIRRVRSNPTPFGLQGKPFRPGAVIDERELWPDEEWPVTPLLLENAGGDYTRPLERPLSGWGQRRRPQIHILWRYEGDGEWREMARASTVDNEWVEHFAAIARLELARDGRRVAPVEIAVRVSRRWFEAIDRDLRELDEDELALALGFAYEEITARLVDLDRVA